MQAGVARTIKAIDGKSPPKAENEAITFGDIQVSSPKKIANYFNRQFTTSKLGRHTSSRETRIVSREIKRKSLMSAVTFTTDQVIKGISNCSNTKAFGPDKLSIFHLKNLGPRAIEYLTALFNDSVTSCRIPAIWKSSIVIPIPKPGKDSSLGTSYRPISLLCPAAKVMEALILTTVNTHLLPASDQHGFRTGHSTTSALLQLTSDVATGFNQRKNNNSQGPDKLNIRHLKHIGPLGLAFLTSMFKTALNKNTIPHTWKLANIVPIPKPNKDTDKGTSYRPISLLSVIAKILEKCIIPYITANIPNTPMQHGYKTQHSAVTALHTLNNIITPKGLPCTNNHCSTRYEQSFRHNKHTHTNQTAATDKHSRHNH